MYLKMCALFYYLCLKYALFHFFFPFSRTHHHHLVYIVSITGRAEGSFCFPEPSVAVGTWAGSHLLAYSVVGRRIAQAL